ncbi:MAG: hypothetical protein BWZ10_02108 [candidate division BRC1 bacterium ADurb.BinA364]|nr:MAG: hypothetical protein BWZ10_02108 [candidate division BRC1 bacterium ADurb.BinA364]
MSLDVAPEIQRADMRGCRGDGHHAVVQVIAPDAHVAVAALGLDGVVPTMFETIAVDVRVAVGRAGAAIVRSAADDVVVVVVFVGPDFVVADHMVAAGVEKRNALRTVGMPSAVSAIGVHGLAIFVPAVGVVARMMDAVALDDEPLDRRHGRVVVLGVNPRIAIQAPFLAFQPIGPPPAADVAILDDHVMRSRVDVDAVRLAVLEGQSAQNDIGGADFDALLGFVGDIDCRGFGAGGVGI